MDRKFPLHPFLFALYPILSFWVTNKNFVFLSETWRTLTVCLGGTGILYLVFWLLSRNKGKSALLTSLLVVVILYFGHVYFSIQGLVPFFDQPVPYFTLWFLGLLAGLYLALRVYKQNELVNTYLNWVSLILVVFPLLQAIQISISRLGSGDSQALASDASGSVQNVNSEHQRPDIYYIILDGYGRADALSEFFSFDNSSFLNALRQRGFYVADQSYTNYMQTFLSISSSLNGTYLEEAQFDPSSDDRTIIHAYLNKSAHLERFRELGYEIIALQDADSLLHLNTADQVIPVSLTLNNFELGFHELTLGRFWSPALYEYTQWEIIRAQLNVIETLPLSSERPRFIFAHLLIPHPPFVFDPDGNFVTTNLYMAGDGSHYGGTRQGYVSGYTGQVQYINSRVIKLLDRLLGNLEHPVVIILQGDHGPGSYLDWASLENTCLRERLPILNAYYFPEGTKRTGLYATISPVNSFRVVFNQILDQPMSLLEDRSFYSEWDRPYDLIDVTDSKDTCTPLQ